MSFIHSSTSSCSHHCRVLGNEGCSLFITLHLSCSFLLRLFLFYSIGSLSWETVFQELLQRESVLWSTVHQKQTISMWVLQGTVCARKPAPVWAPLHRMQFLLGVWLCLGYPRAAPSLRMHAPAAACGSLWDAVWTCAPLWLSMGCR